MDVVAANMSNINRRQPTTDDVWGWKLGEGLTSQLNEAAAYTGPRNLAGHFALGKQRKKDKLYNFRLIFLGDLMKNVQIGAKYSMHGEMWNACKVLFEKCEGMRHLGRPRHKWDNNIELENKERDREDLGWILYSVASE
jgi:hypothetical protein